MYTELYGCKQLLVKDFLNIFVNSRLIVLAVLLQNFEDSKSYSHIFFQRDIFIHSIFRLSAKFKALLFSFPIWHRKKLFFTMSLLYFKFHRLKLVKNLKYGLKKSMFKICFSKYCT